MGIATMVRLVHERQEQEKEDQQVTLRKGKPEESLPKVTEEPEEAKHLVTTALERLTGFIPTEVVAGWGAAVGIIGPTKALASWLIFVVTVVFLIVLLLLETAVRDKKIKAKTEPRRAILMIIVASLAFITWACATPGSPAGVQWGAGTTRYFGVVAIVVSAILPKLSQWLGLAPID